MGNKDKTPNIFSVEEILRLLEEIPGITMEKARMLRHHWAALVASPDRSDLTRLESPNDIAVKHYLDSAMPLKFMELPSPLLDIGSGAGFPGLILKILSPQTEVILGEVRPKRTAFMQQVIDALGLKGVTVFSHRIGPQFPHEIQGVVTRALESARDTLYRVQPFLPEGGRVILLKGPRGSDEIAEAVGELTDFVHEKTYRFNLRQSEHQRQIVVFRRQQESVRTKTIPGTRNMTRRIEITSRANEQFKSLLALGEARGIKKQQKFIVSGDKLVSEILASTKLKTRLEAVIIPAEHTAEIPAPQIALAPQLFRELDVFGTKQPLALMRTGEIPEWNPAGTASGLTVFLPFQDPGNIGAAIRSAAAFGASRVVLLREAASPYLPKAVRAAANSIFSIEILSGPSIAELVQLPLKIFRLDMKGAAIDSVQFTAPVFLLPGVEGYGFKEEGNTVPVRIPISADVESLNAQSALSIALYAIAHKTQIK